MKNLPRLDAVSEVELAAPLRESLAESRYEPPSLVPDRVLSPSSWVVDLFSPRDGVSLWS